MMQLPHIRNNRLSVVIILSLLLIVAVIGSCIKEEADLSDPQVRLKPGIALPAVHVHYVRESNCKCIRWLSSIIRNIK